MSWRRPSLLGAPVAALVLLAAACTGGPASEADPGPLRTDSGLQDEAKDARPECDDLADLVTRTKRGYFPFRSPDIAFIPREPNYVGSAALPVHSGPWDYLAEVPLVAYGPGHIVPGTYNEIATMTDLAPTTAALIGFDEWPDRDGRVLEEMLQPGAAPPKLVVSVVWDGGGWNALETHPDQWPFLKSLMEEKGALYGNFDIGSSPSVTPPIHTNLGTGAFPSRHGMASLKIRDKNYEQVDPFGGLTADRLKITTLSDAYDLARGNEPVTGMLGSKTWHLGMIGHGSALPGADKDPVAILEKLTGLTNTNENIYTVPDISDLDRLAAFGDELDTRDGSRDGKWRGHPLAEPDEVHYTPAIADYEEWLLRRLIRAEGFGADEISDLLYVNFKTADVAGHKWGMTSPEVGEIIKAQDTNLRRFMDFLDRSVGEDEWVLFLTADHGQTPYPHESGAWPIFGGELAADMNSVFDKTDDDINLISSVGAAGVFVRIDQLDVNDAKLGKMARWVSGYTIGENIKEGAEVPDGFEGRQDELLMDAVLVKDRLVSVVCRKA